MNALDLGRYLTKDFLQRQVSAFRTINIVIEKIGTPIICSHPLDIVLQNNILPHAEIPEKKKKKVKTMSK